MKIRKLIFKIQYNIYSLLNKNKRDIKEITKEEADEIMNEDKNVILIDVRSRQEYDEGHFDKAICIPNYEIASKIEKKIPDKKITIILYCSHGIRSKKSLEILEKLGYKNVYSIYGGIEGNK